MYRHWSSVQAVRPIEGVEVQLYSFLTTALEGGEGSASSPGHSLPSGKTRYPLYRRLGGPQGRSGRVWKISPPPGFDPRTFQPVASSYTDYATWPVIILLMLASETLHRYCRKFCYIIFIYCSLINPVINPLTPNDLYISRTAPLTSKSCISYIYSTNVGTEYFKHALYSPFFSLQNAVCFIMLTCLVSVLFTFYIESVLKSKKIIPAPKG